MSARARRRAAVAIVGRVTGRPAELRLQGYIPIRAAEVPLARAAGGEVVEVPGAMRGRRFWITGLIRSAITVARSVGRRTGAKPRDVLLALNKAGFVKPVGEFAETGNFHADEINGALAGILGCPVVTGPIRSWPDGHFDIQRAGGAWEPATDELLGALDAESRLDGKQTMEHFAAQTILRWQGKGDATE